MLRDQSFGLMNPIGGFFGGSGEAINERIASNNCFSWARVFCAKLSCCRASNSVLCSRALSWLASSWWVASTSRNCTKARITYTDTSTARGVFSTVAAIKAPYSVNASGNLRRPPRPRFDVAICDIKLEYSSGESWNMNSAGKRPLLRRTCSFRRRVSTPYRVANSWSRMTFCPRTRTIRRAINSVLGDRLESLSRNVMVLQSFVFESGNHSTKMTKP